MGVFKAINVTQLTALVDLNESFYGSDVQIYPNPVSDILNITFNNFQNRQIKIIDVYGRTILCLTSSKQFEELDLSKYQRGVYIICIQARDGIVKRRFVLE
jgi:hypothetical protein